LEILPTPLIVPSEPLGLLLLPTVITVFLTGIGEVFSELVLLEGLEFLLKWDGLAGLGGGLLSLIGADGGIRRGLGRIGGLSADMSGLGGGLGLGVGLLIMYTLEYLKYLKNL